MTTTLAPNPQIASDAMAYQGHSYIYGGAPGNDGKSGWDCSSFCNYVIGHDLGGAIPGFAAGSYTGAVHGPSTLSWLAISPTKGISKSDLQPGDLIVWQTHMGIYTGNGNMISALNPQLGTRVTTISDGSPGGEIPFYKRYTGSLSAGSASLTGITIPNPFSPSQDINAIVGPVASAVGSGIGTATGDIAGAALNGLLGVFGIHSVKDFLIRAGLLVLGVVIIIEGVRSGFGGSGMRSTSGNGGQANQETPKEETSEAGNQMDSEIEGIEA